MLISQTRVVVEASEEVRAKICIFSQILLDIKSNQISFIGLVSSKGHYKQPSGVVCENGHVSEFLSGVMCAVREGCEKMWGIRVYQGTGTASWRPEGS